MADEGSGLELRDRVALVTGGSRGLGRACALALAEAGAHVVVAARTPAAVDAAVADIRSIGGSAEGRRLDVSDPEAIVELYGALDEVRAPDVVVNAAGAFQDGTVAHTSVEDWLRICATNATSTLVSCREASQRMRRQGWGRIINVCSVAGALRGVPGAAAYAMSKGAVAALTRCLAVEVGHKGLTVNAVAPGMFATEMTDVFRADGQRTEWALSRAPVGRWGDPAELGALVRYLASPGAAFVTGQIIAADGGWTS
jgi:NAD(P)-dependent dehydrogenase (short-subunit alcohol dehydrogenase family)